MNEAAVKSILVLLMATAKAPAAAMADPRDAERFTHIAGFNLADLPSFEEYARRFGVSPIKSTGDAADAEDRVCYRLAQGDTVVELFHGEVDWGFSLHRPRKNDGQCPVAKSLSADQLNIAGVALGMSVAQYEEITGKPTGSKGPRVTHRFEYTHVLTDAELDEMIARGRNNSYAPEDPKTLRRWDVGISLTGVFADGHLVSFSVDRVETN